MPSMTILRKHLRGLGACNDAMEWIGARTPRQAWDECERADWLLWWAAKTKVNSHQQIVLAACGCARFALKNVPPGENRPRLAIEAAERWAVEPTEDNWYAAASAAYAAAYAAYAAASAANAAASAANAAYAAASAAASAANAAYAAASAAYAAAYAAASAANAASRFQKKMCTLVRKILKLPYSKAAIRKATEAPNAH